MQKNLKKPDKPILRSCVANGRMSKPREPNLQDTSTSADIHLLKKPNV